MSIMQTIGHVFADRVNVLFRGSWLCFALSINEKKNRNKYKKVGGYHFAKKQQQKTEKCVQFDGYWK